jgi:pyruvate dehydrogenase E1 component beta subunit
MTRKLTYVQAIREALAQTLARRSEVFVMGLGVDDPTGVFGSTLNLHKEFGNERAFDLPLCEEGTAGFAHGAALVGMRPVVVHQRCDFLLLAMNQIVNHAAKWRYMFGERSKIPVVFRSVIGRGWGQGAQHSQSLQALFAHVPGLKVVMPVSPYDAKGLLVQSILDDDPVILFEHRNLYGVEGEVPEEYYTVPLGKGRICRTGKELTIVAFSQMVQEAEKASDLLEKEGIGIEVIDPRCLFPLDEELILESVRKTGRLIVADTAWKTGGFSAEIAARVGHALFGKLKAPIERVTLPDRPTPSSAPLEKAYYPGADDLVRCARAMLRRDGGASGEDPRAKELAERDAW